MIMAPTRLQKSRESSPLSSFPAPSSFTIVTTDRTSPLYFSDRCEATFVKARSKGCETSVAAMAAPKQKWYLRLWSCLIHSWLCSSNKRTIHMQEKREVRSLSTENAAATGKTFLTTSSFISELPICVLILLMSTKVLSSPSAATPSSKFCWPRVRKHKLPMMMERQPLKKPRQKVSVLTLLASKRATSWTRLRAILRTLMESSGQASRWMADESSPVVITLCTIPGSFPTCGMAARRWLWWYFRIMWDFYSIFTQVGSSSMAQLKIQAFNQKIEKGIKAKERLMKVEPKQESGLVGGRRQLNHNISNLDYKKQFDIFKIDDQCEENDSQVNDILKRSIQQKKA